MTSASFAKMATVTASVLRSPGKDGEGKVGKPIVHIAELKCIPLVPLADAEIVNQLNLQTPQGVSQTYVQDGPDIKEGDILVINTVQYQIRAVEDWPWRPDNADRLKLTVLELKTRPAP